MSNKLSKVNFTIGDNKKRNLKDAESTYKGSISKKADGKVCTRDGV
jgi:hypothetical protein